MFFDKRAERVPLPPLPYVVSPSGKFDGNDGKWSTFTINVGDDGSGRGQSFRILISTSSGVTQVPSQTGWCPSDECAQSRGIILYEGKQSLGFNSSESLAWADAGVYDIPLPYWLDGSNMTVDNGDEPASVWGVDNVGLGESSTQSDILQEQNVVKYTVENFFMGSFGLAAGATGANGAIRPNFIDNFYGSAKLLASRSFGYTAGAYYRNDNKGVPGSLVLGGYDKAKMSRDGTSIDMPSEKNNTLVVGVMSMLYAPDANVEARTESLTKQGGFYATIDSTLPYLILPDNICDELVTKFGLTFDDRSALYIVNSSSHTANMQQNAQVSFKIGASSGDSNDFTSIILPYSAFDHQANYPLVDNTTQYFPIKRSDNGIYVLGRTFLQEAYIIVDYERANFTVAPADFSKQPTEQQLITITNTTYVLPIPKSHEGGGGLSAGAIAGIVVGIVAVFVIAGLGAFFLWRKRRAAERKAAEEEKPSEIDTTFAGSEVKHRRFTELTGSEAPQPPKDSTTDYYTADHKSIPPISEMSPESTPAELYSPPPDGRDTFDYFVAGRMRRRGATRDRDSSGNNTPRTPIAELPGEDARSPVRDQKQNTMASLQKPPHSRSPSDHSLSTNIDEVIGGAQKKEPATSAVESKTVVESGEPATAEEIAKAKAETPQADAEEAVQSAIEQRPAHARALSDTTIQSDSTAVSQPTPEELERWARSVDDGPARPMSP